MACWRTCISGMHLLCILFSKFILNKTFLFTLFNPSLCGELAFLILLFIILSQNRQNQLARKLNLILNIQYKTSRALRAHLLFKLCTCSVCIHCKTETKKVCRFYEKMSLIFKIHRKYNF